MIADAHPADGDQKIGPREGIFERAPRGLGVVGHQGRYPNVGACLLGHDAQPCRVRFSDASRPVGFSRRA